MMSTYVAYYDSLMTPISSTLSTSFRSSSLIARRPEPQIGESAYPVSPTGSLVPSGRKHPGTTF